MRVTAGGLVPPRKVLVATWLAFGIAVAAGAYLIALVGWELLAIGAASILAGVLYTGGPRPYGYEGLGEVFVFTFFGLVAVVGSYYVQTEELTALAFALGVPVGLLSAAILMVNNIRDIDTDRRAGKRTLAVRLGRRRAIAVFAATLCAGVRLDARASRSRRPSRGSRCRCWPCRWSPPLAAHRRDPHRRAGAERRAGAHRDAARGLLAAAVGRPAAGLLSDARSSALEVVPYALPFKEPYVTARGRLERRELLLVRLHADGLVGLGEAAPLALRGGASLAEIARLELPDVVSAPLSRSGDTADASAGVSAQARLAIELALLGPARQGRRRAGCRAARGARAGRCACNATLVAGAPAAVAAKAREWADAGLRHVQAEGRASTGDVEQVRAVRDGAARPTRASGWTPTARGRSTRRRRGSTAMAPLELAEQPVATLDEHARAARRAPTRRSPPTRASSRSTMRARAARASATPRR